MTKENDYAFAKTAVFNDSYSDEPNNGLTKLEYFSAMAKVPDAILQGLVDSWEGEGGNLPLWDSEMINQFAKLEAEYKVSAAKALIEQLNKE